MSVLIFLFGYLALAFGVGAAGANAKRRWVEWSSVAFAGCLPGLLFLALSARDAYLFDRPLFDLVSESGRFGFYVGGNIALWATPIWLLAGMAGLALVKLKRKVR